MKKFAVALTATLMLGACTTTQRVSVEQPGDRAMSCSQLSEEFTKLDRIITDGQSDRGVNGANVAAVLFFWPAAVGNYVNASEAIKIAEQRKEHLLTIYNRNNCDRNANNDLVIQVPTELLAPIGRGSL